MKISFWVVFALLIVFILLPVLMLFKESVIGEVPIPEAALRERVSDVMQQIPEDQQAAWAEEWLDQLDETEAANLYIKAVKEAGLEDRIGVENVSLAAIKAQIAELSAAEQQAVMHEVRLDIFLAKRSPFMFKAKPFISQEQFENLRSGQEKVLTMEHYNKVFTTDYLWGTITRSLRIASVSMVFTVAMAYLFAYVINRTTVRFKGFFNAMMLLPLVSPPVIMSFALVMLFGRNGIITNGLLDQRLHLIDAQTTNIYGLHGIVLAQMLTYGPMAFVILHSVLAQLDTRTEEAAESLGASRWTIFLRVTLPMSLPGLFRASLLTFALCLQDFGNPRIIGGELIMIAGVMYDQMISLQNPNVAAVLGLLLLIPSIIAFVVGTIYLGRRTFASSEPGGIQYVHKTAPWSKRAFEACCSVYSLIVLGMYLTIVWGSVVKVWGYDNTLTLAYYTVSGITSASGLDADIGQKLGLPLILESVRTMAIAGGLGGLLAVVAGYVLQRVKSAFSDIAGYVIMLTVALPGVVFGIGYILAFNTPFGMRELSLIGTLWIIILLIIFTRMYGGVLPTQAVLEKVDVSVEEAAISLGASRFYTFRRVIFPALRRPWLLGSLYIFVSGLVALGGVIFLVSARYALASVEIYLLAERGKFGLACSHSTYLITIVLLVQFLIRYLERSRGERAMILGV